jgi:hypothetical protein
VKEGALISGAKRGTWIVSDSGAAMLVEYDARRTHQERQMTLEVSYIEKRAGLWSANGLDRRSLVARTGPAEAVKAARALPLDVGSDAGTQR